MNSAAELNQRLVLEITRGRTRFPLRPVAGERFLIGAAVTCDLRLGGPLMPALHSIIHTADGCSELDAISAVPALKINGVTVDHAYLNDGDRIEIGDVELTARLVAQAEFTARGTPPRLAVPDSPATLEELSTSELLELWRQETGEIAQWESRERLAEQNLLNAVRQTPPALRTPSRVDTAQPVVRGPHFPLPAATPAATAPAAHSGAAHSGATSSGATSSGVATSPVLESLAPLGLDDLRMLEEQLAALSDELRQSLLAADGREGKYAQSLSQLLSMQQKLTRQIEELADSVARLQQERHPFEGLRTRAIA
ncbi:MAG: FHA domain-containing protein [Planctomycetaceae bacterium]